MEIRFLDQKIEMEKCEEGQEIFDPEEERFIKKLVDIEVAGGGELLDFKRTKKKALALWRQSHKNSGVD